MIFFISVTEYHSELEIDKGVGCPRVQRCKPCGSNSQRKQAKRQNTARCGDIKGLFRHKAQTERPQSQLGTRLQAEGKHRRAHRGRIPPQGRRENRVSASETEAARKNTQTKQTAARVSRRRAGAARP